MVKKASIIDYPRRELDKSIWKIDDEELALQPNIKDDIADIVGSFLDDLDLPEESIIDVLIYGSILTNQYNSQTDVDARILLDPKIISQYYPGMTGDQLYDVTMDTVHGVLLGNTKHPFNATIVVEGEKTELGQAPLGISDRDPVYSIKKEKVIHEGLGYDESFDPDKEFTKERVEVTEIMTKLDNLVQDAKTKAIDIEVLEDAVGQVSNSDQLIKKIEERLKSLNTTIQKMVSEYNSIKEERGRSYKEAPVDNRHKAPGNIREKFLEKYRYIDMLKKLKRLFKGGIDTSEVEDVAKTLNIAGKMQWGIKIQAVNINKKDLHTLWYENEAGDKFIPDLEGAIDDPPEEFVYQFSQFPNELTLNMLYLVESDKVENCQHPEEAIKATYGWIDGIEGRECTLCNGTQTKKIDEDWPKEWDAYGSRDVGCGHSSWSEDLVLALANSNDFTLSEAILIAGNACSRCMNALAYEYGLDWGYPEFSEEWKNTNTECDFCKDTKDKKQAALPYRQPGPPETLEAPPTMQTGPAAPSSIDVGRIDEGGMLNQVHGSTCPHCGHVNPMTANESDEITCEGCGKKFEAKDGFSLGTGVSTPPQTNPYAYESDFALYGQIDDIKTGHLLSGVTIMKNLIRKLDKINADSTGGTGGVFGEPPGKNPGDDPYSSGGGALAEYGTEGEPEEDKKKKKKREIDDDMIWEIVTVLDGIDIAPFLEDDELLEELLAAFPLFGEASTKIDRIVGLVTEPPEGSGQYSAPVNPDYDTEPHQRPRKRKIGPLEDGTGRGKGRPSGLRRNKNTEECPVGGPGKGDGEGRGRGKFRKKIEETGEAVGIDWFDSYPTKYNAADNEMKELILEWLESNPNPDDDDVHALADEVGMESDELEEIIYELATDHAEEDDTEDAPDADSMEGVEELDVEMAEAIGEEIGIDWEDSPFDPEQFLMGLNVELEHGTKNPETNVTNDDLIETAKIAWAHLKEIDDYYDRLKQMEDAAKEHTKDTPDTGESEETDSEETESDETESGGTVGGFSDGFPGKTAAAYMTLCPTCKTIQKAPIEGEGIQCPFCSRGWLDSLENSDPAKYAEYKEQNKYNLVELQEQTQQQRGMPHMGTRLDKKVAQQINQELSNTGLDGNTSFHQAHMGYHAALEILETYGLKPVTGIDDYPLIADNEGQRFLDLEYNGERLENMKLTFSWYKHTHTGNYECIAHLNY